VARSSFIRRVKPSPPTDRAIRRLLLNDAGRKIYGDSRGTDGYPRVGATRQIESGLIMNHKVEVRIMQQLLPCGLHQSQTATRNLIAGRTTSDLLKRDSTTTGSNQL